MKLINANYGDNREKALEIMKKIQSEADETEFAGVLKRLNSANTTCLIVENDKIVGFLYLLTQGENGLLFLDMAILKEYRNKGIGYSVIKELLSRINFSEFILAEVKDDNIACLKMIEKLKGVQVYPNHYLLQPERYIEFKKFKAIYNRDLTLPSISPHDAVQDFYKSNDDQKVKVKRR